MKLRVSALVAPLVALVALALPHFAGAQISRRRGGYQPEPQYSVGLAYGYMDGGSFFDAKTGNTWNLGYSSQIQATLDKAIQGGASIGVSAGFGNAAVALANCVSCNTSVDVTQYMVYLHGGRGVGFHGMYNLEAGATEFSNLRDRDSDADLGVPAQYDFTFGFGGGIGYGFSPTTEGYVGETLDLVLHDQGTAVSTSAPRFYTFRLGFRVGF